MKTYTGFIFGLLLVLCSAQVVASENTKMSKGDYCKMKANLYLDFVIMKHKGEWSLEEAQKTIRKHSRQIYHYQYVEIERIMMSVDRGSLPINHSDLMAYTGSDPSLWEIIYNICDREGF